MVQIVIGMLDINDIVWYINCLVQDCYNPLGMHWNYCNLALSHRYKIDKENQILISYASY